MKGDRGVRRNPGKQAIDLNNTNSACISPPNSFGEPEMDVWNRAIQSKTPEFWQPCDQDFLILYCQAVARVGQVQKEIAAQGSVLKTRHGPKANPLLFELERLERKMLMLGTRLQLTPASRHLGHLAEDGRNTQQRRERAAKERLTESDGLLATPMSVQ